uniref:Uncharacterized protein n=1 Tax=Mus musculus TaxID=10090 RepID=Q9D362_MOUSE|nr:unnamed protein product [Mus musculus]
MAVHATVYAPELSADSARLLGVCGPQASPARPQGPTRGGLSYTSSELGVLPRPQEPNFLGPPSRCEGDREKPESGESSLPRTGDTGTPEPERPPRQRLGRRINLRWTAPPPAYPSSPGTLRPAEASFPQGERTARDSGRACWQSGQLGKALIQ